MGKVLFTFLLFFLQLFHISFTMVKVAILVWCCFSSVVYATRIATDVHVRAYRASMLQVRSRSQQCTEFLQQANEHDMCPLLTITRVDAFMLSDSDCTAADIEAACGAGPASCAQAANWFVNIHNAMQVEVEHDGEGRERSGRGTCALDVH